MAKGDSPYSTGFANGRVNPDLDPAYQMRQYKREERETHSAPMTLPFEMASLPQYYADMVEGGMQACKVLEKLLESKNVKHKEELAKLKRNTEKMVLYLMDNVDATLDKFIIGGSMEADDDEDQS